ncbi:hypothetical protein QN277_005739 [Acacia crassicarpa]|uniref:F-box domain-containing protein n=1 Tax=Acacia crassicarpa TaxID=499986 RepID=A0AAE1IWW6_9FABA|nr:hypothetical protein QN277_005739 [Acacia crassicarpa]
MPFLPEEIIRNILTKLPVKTLIRSRCVCKHWKNLIRSPSFISDHLHHSSTHQNPSLLLERDYDLWLLDCKMQLHEVRIAPLLDSPSTFHIVGSSNGLLCVRVGRDCEFYPYILLWNPATREVRQLPPNTPNTKGVHLPLSIGFGFSPVINDYKVVITYHNMKGINFDPVSPYSLLVVVYSLSSGSWKKVEFGVKNFVLVYESVTMNGIMFLSGRVRNPDTNTYYNAIVSFDLASELFTLIPTPDWCTSTYTLTMYENKLAVLSFFATQDSESLIELSVMEDGSGASWAKKYSSSCLIPSVVRPMMMTVWMNQIVCDGSERECYQEPRITLLNISTNELKTFNISQCGRGTGCRFILHHTESLVPIGE